MKQVVLADVLAFNRALIERYTGTYFPPDNLKQPKALDYLLDLCRNNVIFGVPQYPTVSHVAALLLYKMVNGHYFHDGNKRTAVMTMRYFLFVNGYEMKKRLQTVVVDANQRIYIPRRLQSNAQDIIVALVEELAQPERFQLEYDDVLRFIQQNTQPIPTI